MKQEVKNKIEEAIEALMQLRIKHVKIEKPLYDIQAMLYNAIDETESPKVEWIAEQVHMEVVKDLTDELSTAKARIVELESSLKLMNSIYNEDLAIKKELKKENERLRGLVELYQNPLEKGNLKANNNL